MSELIHFMKVNKSLLISEWIEIYEKNHSEKIRADGDHLSKLGSQGIDILCQTLKTNDCNMILEFVEELIATEKTELFLIEDALLVLSSARNMLLTSLSRNYSDKKLSTMLLQVNKLLDRVNLFLCLSFQDMQEQKCRNYADQLETQIQERTTELEESRNNYQILFEKINDGCFVNQKGKIVFANRAFCEMHSYERDEMIGMECQNLIADDSRKMVMEKFYKHLKGQNRFDSFIYCRKDKAGNSIPTENRIKLIKYKEKPAVLGLSTDITKRLEMEEKVKQKDRLALIGRLTTSIAHEIRNPLSAIKVNIQILQENLDIEGNDLRRLQIAHEQSVLLENILSETLQFAKPIKLEYSLCDLKEVIDQATECLEEKISAADISVKREIDSEVDYIMIDREKIIETVTNILKNAIEAFEEEVSERKKIKIIVKSKMIGSKKHVCLSIRDNGKGIGPNDKDSIFEPFVTKGKKGGIGLGLSIVNRFVEAHNGFFNVESSVGEGTSFSFIIPSEITL